MGGVVSRPRKKYWVTLTQRSAHTQMSLTIARIEVEGTSEKQVRQMLNDEIQYLSKWQQIEKTKAQPKTLPWPRRWIPLQWLQVPFIITSIKRKL
jgi:hypothetical protein